MNKNKLIFKELFNLALPIILSNVVSASSSLISMFFIAKINTAALASGAIITSSYGLIMMAAMSILYSISISIGHSKSGGNSLQINEIISSGISLALILSIPLILLFQFITPILDLIKQPHKASQMAGDYFNGLTYSIIPCMILAVFTQFFMGIKKTKLVFYLTVIGALINSLLSYLFIFGFGNIKPLYLYGAGLATSATGLFQLLLVTLYILLKKEFKAFHMFSKRILSFNHVKFLFYVGAPISIQYSIELLSFSVITYLMGLLGENTLAAQQITIQVTMLTIMVIMGFSQAGAILLSHASMESKSKQLMICKTTLYTGIAFMSCISFSYLYFSKQLISLYIDVNNPFLHEIVMISKNLLIVAAITQLFDAGRNISAGLLRGYGDTKSSMWTSINSCWLIGLPLSIIFTFNLNLGAIGLRLGMMLGILYGFIQLTQKLVKNNFSKDALLQFDSQGKIYD